MEMSKRRMPARELRGVSGRVPVGQLTKRKGGLHQAGGDGAMAREACMLLIDLGVFGQREWSFRCLVDI
jgi:hypothetical protein